MSYFFLPKVLLISAQCPTSSCQMSYFFQFNVIILVLFPALCPTSLCLMSYFFLPNAQVLPAQCPTSPCPISTSSCLMSYFLPDALLLPALCPTSSCPMPYFCLSNVLLLPVQCPTSSCPMSYLFLSNVHLLPAQCPTSSCPMSYLFLSNVLLLPAQCPTSSCPSFSCPMLTFIPIPFSPSHPVLLLPYSSEVNFGTAFYFHRRQVNKQRDLFSSSLPAAARLSFLSASLYRTALFPDFTSHNKSHKKFCINLYSPTIIFKKDDKSIPLPIK
jgi:hypothetical protein